MENKCLCFYFTFLLVSASIWAACWVFLTHSWIFLFISPLHLSRETSVMPHFTHMRRRNDTTLPYGKALAILKLPIFVPFSFSLWECRKSLAAHAGCLTLLSQGEEKVHSTASNFLFHSWSWCWFTPVTCEKVYCELPALLLCAPCVCESCAIRNGYDLMGMIWSRQGFGFDFSHSRPTPSTMAES